MSYTFPRLRHQPAPPAPVYPLIPLSQAQIAPQQPHKKELVVAAVVIILLIAFMYWMNREGAKPVQPNRGRAKKQSTKEMARNLYKRLEDRGGVNDTTMRSLRALGAGRK